MKPKERASSAGHGNLDEKKGDVKEVWDKTLAAINKPEKEEKCIECPTLVYPSHAYANTNAGPICSRTCNETHKERSKANIGGAWGSFSPAAIA